MVHSLQLPYVLLMKDVSEDKRIKVNIRKAYSGRKETLTEKKCSISLPHS